MNVCYDEISNCYLNLCGDCRRLALLRTNFLVFKNLKNKLLTFELEGIWINSHKFSFYEYIIVINFNFYEFLTIVEKAKIV